MVFLDVSWLEPRNFIDHAYALRALEVLLRFAHQEGPWCRLQVSQALVQGGV